LVSGSFGEWLRKVLPDVEAHFAPPLSFGLDVVADPHLGAEDWYVVAPVDKYAQDLDALIADWMYEARMAFVAPRPISVIGLINAVTDAPAPPPFPLPMGVDPQGRW
jgi:hypothetical protein